ncbi:DUF6270 domain-containing protein [Neobacillus vireti]|uniref:DUF6270 domain-containing protein n=1 Tax=Neobacillus vireti TaxID=220686 RepID=UPI002FFE9E61
MEANITSIEFSQGELLIKGKTNVELEPSASFWLRKRDEEFETYEWKQYPVRAAFREHGFELKCAAQDLGFVMDRNLEDKAVWDFFLYQNNRYIPLKMEGGVSVPNQSFPVLHPLYKVWPYVAKTKGLSLYVVQVKMKALLVKEQFNNGVYEVEVDLKAGSAVPFHHFKTCLVLRRREQMGFFEYYEEKTVNVHYKNNLFTVSVDLRRLFNDDELKDEEICWDLFIGLIDGPNMIYLPISQTNKIQECTTDYVLNDLYKVKPLFTHDIKSLYIRPITIHAQLVECKVQDNLVRFKGTYHSNEMEDPTFENGQLHFVLKKRTHLNKQIAFTIERVEKVMVNQRQFNGSFDIAHLLGEEHIKDNDVWDMFIRFSANNQRVDSHLSPDFSLNFNVPYETFRSNPQFLVKPYVNVKRKFSVLVRDAKRAPRPVMVAVIGSCYCRSAFNSTSYFNPDYKEYYNCVYTQFHSSVISLMSQPVPLDQSKMENLNDKQKEFIKCDFDKKVFERLSLANPEYVLIDFFADAARNLIKINDQSYISNSHILAETALEQELITSNENIISHKNNEQYFELWKEAADQFIDRILTIIPQERIILNLGGFNDRYYDAEGKVVLFREYRQQIIRRNNYLWDRLNQYFISKLPKLKIIDLRTRNFIGHYNHPLGLSPAHYESDYYKEFLKELNDILFKDLIVNRK